MESIGQKTEVWDQFWNGLTPESEIRMWDFYGGRQWISKYVPRYGNVIEAGCGLGRYVFYFSKLGIDIDGVDFSKPTIEFLNKWKLKYGFKADFKEGDVTNLPYENNSLRGYISLGVIEHFIEGPHKAITEAFRVLQPGGIAIITTPSISWNVFRERLKRRAKNIVKKIIRYNEKNKEFFQYEYRPSTLKKLIESSGLKVTAYDGADLLYTFTEFGNFSGENISKGSFAYWFSNTFENTFFRKIGAQSITISVKVADKMYCFLCGKLEATPKSLKGFTVPLCKNCADNELTKLYKIGIIPKFAVPYLINPPLRELQKDICEFSGKEYETDKLFEDFGFTKNVSPQALSNPQINILLCNNFLKPIWRKRKI